MVIWPDAINAQNKLAAVSAQGSTVCVLIRRLNSSCNRSMAFDVRIDFHSDGRVDGGKTLKAGPRSETLHHSLSFSKRDVGILSAIV
jgi:hypothetical protein